MNLLLSAMKWTKMICILFTHEHSYAFTFIFTPDGISYTDPASAALVSTHYFNDSIITRSLYNESVRSWLHTAGNKAQPTLASSKSKEGFAVYGKSKLKTCFWRWNDNHMFLNSFSYTFVLILYGFSDSQNQRTDS